MQTASLAVPGRVEFVRPATQFLVQVARALRIPAAAQPVFEVAISEAVTNAIKYGSAARAASTITCELELSEQALVVRIIDDGAGFTVSNIALPDVSEDDVESLPASGYGLPIIQTVFSIVRSVNVDGRFGVELCLQV